MLKNKEAVLFDLDGTLVDSMWVWKDIDIEFLGKRKIDLPENTEELQKELEGMGFTQTAVFFKERFQLEESLDEIKQIWIDMAFEKYMTEVPLKKGVYEFLEMLKEKGIKCGICSSNGRELVEATLKAHGVFDFFSVICTCCEVPNSKPAPDVYLLAAKSLGADPKNCLVFEDVPMGILAGKNAGMEVCAVEDEFSAGQRNQKKELADYYIQDYIEILGDKE